jgi:hypothetical protein
VTEAEQQAEEHRLRRTSRHLILSLGAVIGFAVAFAAIYWWAGSNQSPPPEPTPTAVSPSASTPPVTTSPETMLLQATTPEGAVGNIVTALTSDDTDTDAVATLLPLRNDLIVSSPQSPPAPLQLTETGLDTLRPAAATAATLGVRIDAYWRMDRKALAGLVDSVGGFPVTISERLRIRDEAGLVALRLRPGKQRLTGTDASWYALGDVRGQSAVQAGDRFTAVVTKTLIRLPASDIEIREALTALGALAPSSIGTQDLATYLLDVSVALRAERSQSVTLPVTELAFGDTSVAWLDYSGATPLLRRSVPYALWQQGVDGPARVLVSAPADGSDVLAMVRTDLTDQNLVFVDGRGTPAPSRARTTILGRGDALATRMVAVALADPDAQSEVVPAEPLRGQPWADVDVVLGTDYVANEP